jgi:hypothetical protein
MAGSKRRRARATASATPGASSTLVFLTWSGVRSKAVALALKNWLRDVLQTTNPFMSEGNIAAGAFWDREVRNALELACFGVVCVTAESAPEPWLNYEAGALAERLRGNVCPYLMGIEPNDLQSMPLSRLQAKRADKNGTKELVLAVNSALAANAIPEAVALKAFETHWPELDAALEKIPSSVVKPPKRSLDDMLAETLQLQQAQLGLLETIVQRDDALRSVILHGGMLTPPASSMSPGLLGSLLPKLVLPEFVMGDNRYLEALEAAGALGAAALGRGRSAALEGGRSAALEGGRSAALEGGRAPGPPPRGRAPRYRPDESPKQGRRPRSRG